MNKNFKINQRRINEMRIVFHDSSKFGRLNLPCSDFDDPAEYHTVIFSSFPPFLIKNVYYKLINTRKRRKNGEKKEKKKKKKRLYYRTRFSIGAELV